MILPFFVFFESIQAEHLWLVICKSKEACHPLHHCPVSWAIGGESWSLAKASHSILNGPLHHIFHVFWQLCQGKVGAIEIKPKSQVGPQIQKQAWRDETEGRARPYKICWVPYPTWIKGWQGLQGTVSHWLSWWNPVLSPNDCNRFIL